MGVVALPNTNANVMAPLGIRYSRRTNGARQQKPAKGTSLATARKCSNCVGAQSGWHFERLGGMPVKCN